MAIDDMMNGFMLGTMTCMALKMISGLAEAMHQETVRIEKAVNHQVYRENWDDYCQYWGERCGNPKCLQRAKDREKIRRLVFGDDTGNSESL